MWLIIYIIEDGRSISHRGHLNFCGLGLPRAGLIGFWTNFGMLAIATSLWIPDLYADWKWSSAGGMQARAGDRTPKMRPAPPSLQIINRTPNLLFPIFNIELLTILIYFPQNLANSKLIPFFIDANKQGGFPTRFLNFIFLLQQSWIGNT